MAGETGRFDYLDGIRALAIGAVLSLHWLSWYSPFFHGGSIGVDVFFVLSGFIITTMLWRSAAAASLGIAWWAFIRRRVLRLYPALLGLVVVAIVLYAVTPSAPLAPDEVARRGALVLTQASAFWAADQSGSFWLPALHPFGQSWSLAIEWYFYLLWPLVVLGARQRGATPRRLALGALAVAAGLYLLSLPLSDFWFYFGPSARFAELLVGGALALWLQAAGTTPVRSWRLATPAAAVSVAVIGAVTLLAPAAHHPLYRYVEIPVTVLATVTLIRAGYRGSGGPVHRLLGHRWLAGVGRCSYSLYLWHIVPMLLLQRSALPRPLLALLAVVATIALTALSYHLLERPFLRPRSDVLRPSPGQREPASA